MPSLFNRKSKIAETKADAVNGHNGPAPPSYGEALGSTGLSLARLSDNRRATTFGLPPPGSEPAIDLDAAFAKLDLSNGARNPDTDTCLAHLKLLFAFQTMKEDIGYTDGLWNIWDTCADGNMSVLEDMDVEEEIDPDPESKGLKQKQIVLSKLREKRWALFVARAVDRYEAWWDSLSEGPRLLEADFDDQTSAKYCLFPDAGHDKVWTEMMLPPLGRYLLNLQYAGSNIL